MKKNNIIYKVEKNIMNEREKLKNGRKVLIFGHKNPDTDSICASLVSERLDEKKMDGIQKQ